MITARFSNPPPPILMPLLMVSISWKSIFDFCEYS